MLIALLMFAVAPTISHAQKKSARKAKPAQVEPATELSRLRDEYIKTTREYKASLQKLLALYEDSVKKAEQRRDQANKLLAAGLVAKRDVEQSERAVSDANLKVTGVQQQIATADTQIAEALVEVETEKQAAKLGPMRKGALISYLQSHGIPFSAFRTAIPGVATGPHIHIGMPSHRY